MEDFTKAELEVVARYLEDLAEHTKRDSTSDSAFHILRLVKNEIKNECYVEVSK